MAQTPSQSVLWTVFESRLIKQLGLDKEIQGLLHNGICESVMYVLIYPEGDRFF